MNRIKFTKMVGSGNDFIVIKDKPAGNLSALAKTLCDRKFGIGADGLLLLNQRKNSGLGMRVFNADGSEAQMCGNGARCAAYVIARSHVRFAQCRLRRRGNLKRDCFAPAGLAMTVETKAGIINAQIKGNNVRIKLTDPEYIKLDIPIKVNGRLIKVNSINTGVPHVVIFVEGIADINIAGIGRLIRYHKKFAPSGTNVNFVDVKGPDLIQIRSYERGVEDETLACGTGSVASALVFALKNNLNNLVKVKTQSKEVLKVYFQRDNCRLKNIWLEGSARIVYKGEYYV